MCHYIPTIRHRIHLTQINKNRKIKILYDKDYDNLYHAFLHFATLVIKLDILDLEILFICVKLPTVRVDPMSNSRKI